MNDDKRIVVWDPLGEEPEGEVVEVQRAQQLIARRAATLPYDPRLDVRNGLSGWSKRSWGKGVAFDAIANRRGCPIVLYVMTDHATLNYVLRIIPDPAGEPHGRLRLTTDKNQIGTLALGTKSPTGPIQVEALGEPDKWGGWTVEGKLAFTTRNEGFFGLSLYGKLSACRVAWLAVSQTR
jgi:hypothetical protein